MIEIPIGKALVAEISNGFCVGCYFDNSEGCLCHTTMNCAEDEREDGKSVIFKLVDYPMDKNRQKSTS